MMKIGIIGLGFVGSAIQQSLAKKGQELIVYDKYKNGGVGSLKVCLETEIIFLALPTLYDTTKEEYDKSALHEVCLFLQEHKYGGTVIIKSTVEPQTTQDLETCYGLNLVHNPEFLTARTAFEDFHNQKHIVLGKASQCSDTNYQTIVKFFQTVFPDAEISQCTSSESESMKIFVNSFYATKIQFFNELYLLCQKTNIDYQKVKDLMLKNGWINPMHTNVPGPDGKLSYGGACFPKDTSALQKYMERQETPNEVLKAVIKEQKILRSE